MIASAFLFIHTGFSDWSESEFVMVSETISLLLLHRKMMDMFFSQSFPHKIQIKSKIFQVCGVVHKTVDWPFLTHTNICFIETTCFFSSLLLRFCYIFLIFVI